jgi:hypothetical protein
MPNNSYNVRFVIICDDIRQEVSGKEILIGVYNDAILCPAFPIVIQKLIVRVSVSAPIGSIFKVFKVALADSKDHKLFEIASDVKGVETDDPHLIFAVAAFGVVFPREGTYKILFGIDEEPKVIWEIVVRVPKNQEETKRLR